MASGVLNFDIRNKITGVNVINGHLLFTDNRNEPRKINIARFRDDGDHTSGTTVIYGRDFRDKDISVIKKHPSTGPTVQNISTGTDETIFKDVFPRVAYRWRFKDNEYSPFSPFTEPVYEGGTALDFKDMYETGDLTYSQNKVESFDVVIPISEADIIECDLLYTESISSTVYIVDTKEVSSSDITSGNITFSVNGRNFFKALPASQLNRIFDEVPRKAKAQDIVGNRVIYGNFLEGYNNGSISAALSTTNLSNGAAVPAVRAGFSYNVGVAFIDEKGRQGGLIDLGSISTPFYNADPVKITAQLSGNTPSWASKYRYYIKDVNGEHYNIKSFCAFDNEELSESGANEVWLGVSSEDVNKVQKGDYISHRAFQRINTFPGYEGVGMENLSYGTATNPLNPIQNFNKRKVLEIQNEAPESVKYGLIDKKLVSRTLINSAATTYKFAANNGAYTAASTLEEGEAIIAISGTTLLTEINENLEQNKVVFVSIGSNTGAKIRVTSAEEVGVGSNGNTDGTLIKLATSLTSAAVSGISNSVAITVYVSQFKDEDLKALSGKFFIKTTKEATIGSGLITTNRDNSITFPHLLDDSDMANNGVSCDIFTVEPAEDSNLDLYWEASSDYNASGFGGVDTIDWVNSIALAKNATSAPFVYIDKYIDRFNSVPLGKGVRVNTPLDEVGAQRHKNKLIFSGIINPNTKVNRLNEFIKADGIQKDINPKYGEIQKLYSQDNLFVFCHDKVVKVLANKDALYNADENVNLIATPNVLGQAIGLNGEYGICDDPESFAVFGFNIFFTDRHRGKVLKLTPINGQINDISKNGLRDFFRDRLISANNIIGSYDEYSNKYILCIRGYDASLGLIDQYNMLPGEEGSVNTDMTIGFSDNGQQSGWTSRYSFIPEAGISTIGKYYTFKNGKCWVHHNGSVDHNNFYGDQYHSEVTFVFNDNPTRSNEWVSLNYEGTEGWDIAKIEADQEEGVMTSVDILDSTWFKKEGKYFAPITGEEAVYSFVSAGVPDADGNYPLQDTGQKQPKAGVKGFFNKVTIKNENTTKQELFALSAEYHISSN